MVSPGALEKGPLKREAISKIKKSGCQRGRIPKTMKRTSKKHTRGKAMTP